MSAEKSLRLSHFEVEKALFPAVIAALQAAGSIFAYTQGAALTLFAFSALWAEILYKKF